MRGKTAKRLRKAAKMYHTAAVGGADSNNRVVMMSEEELYQKMKSGFHKMKQEGGPK